MDKSDLFWTHVDKTPGCWMWLGGTSHNGYGQFMWEGKNKRATHVSFFLATGRWPAPGLKILHECDVPGCVRPDHLREGSQRDNVQDAIRKGRMAVGEKNGSAKLTDAQVVEIRVAYEARHEEAGGSQMQIASAYGITQSCVSHIVTGMIRADAGGPITPKQNRGTRTFPNGWAPNAKIDEPIVRQMRDLRSRGDSQAAIAKRFGVSQGQVSHIVRGLAWGWVK